MARTVSPSLIRLALVWVGIGACSDAAPHELRWSIEFANAKTARRVARIALSIARERCDGDTVYEAVVAQGKHAPTPPRLAPGSYALVGRALTQDCMVVAYGCVQTTLPTTDDTAVTVVLDDSPPSRWCDGSCRTRCRSVDAGADAALRDAGTDASAEHDAGMHDAGVDAGPSCDGTQRPLGHCYRFVASPTRNWDDAEADCVDWGGHLVSYNDADEELWVTDRVAEIATFPLRYWLGFRDSARERTWNWSDDSNGSTASVVVYDLGQPSSQRFRTLSNLPYTHWGPRVADTGNAEPNNGNASNPTAIPGEDCATTVMDQVSGPGGIAPRPQWNDQACTALDAYVCERP